MQVDLFNYELPKHLIASKPINPRDAARMLVVNDSIEDSTIKKVADYLTSKDIIVFNDTRVMPVRLRGLKDNNKIELTLIKHLETNIWRSFAKPARRLKRGNEIIFGPNFNAKVISRNGPEVDIQFLTDQDNISSLLDKYGEMPIPPYIDRKLGSKPEDWDNYQTIFAKNPGAIAAPTAGLHFTNNLLRTIEKKGINHVFTTLHVGAGTFVPVKVKDTNDHIMHSEYFRISQETVEVIEEKRRKGGRVVAVGTTSLRVLESAITNKGKLQAREGETSLFITPGYKFKVVDILLTNFHLPCSTLFMLVSAFIGNKKALMAYSHAINEEYRFYSYGDASLLFRSS